MALKRSWEAARGADGDADDDINIEFVALDVAQLRECMNVVDQDGYVNSCIGIYADALAGLSFGNPALPSFTLGPVFHERVVVQILTPVMREAEAQLFAWGFTAWKIVLDESGSTALPAICTPASHTFFVVLRAGHFIRMAALRTAAATHASIQPGGVDLGIPFGASANRPRDGEDTGVHFHWLTPPTCQGRLRSHVSRIWRSAVYQHSLERADLVACISAARPCLALGTAGGNLRGYDRDGIVGAAFVGEPGDIEVRQETRIVRASMDVREAGLAMARETITGGAVDRGDIASEMPVAALSRVEEAIGCTMVLPDGLEPRALPVGIPVHDIVSRRAAYEESVSAVMRVPRSLMMDAGGQAKSMDRELHEQTFAQAAAVINRLMLAFANDIYQSLWGPADTARLIRGTAALMDAAESRAWDRYVAAGGGGRPGEDDEEEETGGGGGGGGGGGEEAPVAGARDAARGRPRRGLVNRGGTGRLSAAALAGYASWAEADEELRIELAAAEATKSTWGFSKGVQASFGGIRSMMLLRGLHEARLLKFDVVRTSLSTALGLPLEAIAERDPLEVADDLAAAQFASELAVKRKKTAS